MGIWKKGTKPNLNPALTVTSFTVFCFVPIFNFSCLSFPVTRFINQKKFQASECPDIYFLIYWSGFYYFTFPCIGQAGENIGIKLQKIKSFRWTLKLADQTEGKDPASPFFCFERCTFRCIWRRTCTPKKLELGQVISSKPLTVRARSVHFMEIPWVNMI